MSRKDKYSLVGQKLNSQIKKQQQSLEKEKEEFLEQALINHEISKLTHLGFKNTWQTKFILALLLLSSAVSAAELAGKVKKADKAQGKRNPVDDKSFLSKFESHLSDAFSKEQKKFALESAEKIPAEERKYVSLCFDLVDQRNKMLGRNNKKFMVPGAITKDHMGSFIYPYSRDDAKISSLDFNKDSAVIEITPDKKQIVPEKLASIIIHESWHCVFKHLDSEKVIYFDKDLPLERKLRMQITDFADQYTPQEIEKYLGVYSGFCKYMKDAVQVALSDMQKNAKTLNFGEKRYKQLAKIGLEYLRHEKQAANTIRNTIGEKSESNKFGEEFLKMNPIKEWERIYAAGESHALYQHLVTVANIYIVLLNYNIETIEREKTLNRKFDEFVAHLSEIPMSLLESLSKEAGSTIKEIKAHCVKAAEEKLKDDGEAMVKTYIVSDKNTREQKAPITLSEYKKLEEEKKRHADL